MEGGSGSCDDARRAAAVGKEVDCDWLNVVRPGAAEPSNGGLREGVRPELEDAGEDEGAEGAWPRIAPHRPAEPLEVLAVVDSPAPADFLRLTCATSASPLVLRFGSAVGAAMGRVDGERRRRTTSSRFVAAAPPSGVGTSPRGRSTSSSARGPAVSPAWAADARCVLGRRCGTMRVEMVQVAAADDSGKKGNRSGAASSVSSRVDLASGGLARANLEAPCCCEEGEVIEDADSAGRFRICRKAEGVALVRRMSASKEQARASSGASPLARGGQGRGRRTDVAQAGPSAQTHRRPVRHPAATDERPCPEVVQPLFLGACRACRRHRADVEGRGEEADAGVRQARPGRATEGRSRVSI